MPNVLVLGIGAVVGPEGLPNLWPDRFLGPRLGEFALRTFGWTPGLDLRVARGTPLPAIVERARAGGFPPDLVLLFGAEWLELPPRVEASPVPTALVVQDWDYWVAHTRFAIAACDVTVAQGEESAATLRRLGANRVVACQLFGALPPAADEAAPGVRDIDVLFPGHLDDVRDPERSAWAARVARLGARFRVLVPGDYVGRSEYFRLLRRAKLVLSHHRRGELAARVLDALAAGALPLDAGATAARLLEDLPYGRIAPDGFEATVAALLADPAALARRVAACRAPALDRFASARCVLELLRAATRALAAAPARRAVLGWPAADRHLGAAAAAFVGSHRSNLAPDGRNLPALAVAEAECAAAVAAAPGARTWTSLAAVLVSRRLRAPEAPGDPAQRAVDLLAAALRADPRSAAAHLTAWRLLASAGRPREAAAHADRALRLLAADPATLDAGCLLPDGVVDASVAAAWERALLGRALGGAAAPLARLAAVGVRLWRAEREPPAAALATLAPVLDDSPAALLAAARRAGDGACRARLLRRAAARLPTRADVRVALAEAALAAGDPQGARAALAEAAALAASVGPAARVRPRLAALARRLAAAPDVAPAPHGGAAAEVR